MVSWSEQYCCVSLLVPYVACVLALFSVSSGKLPSLTHFEIISHIIPRHVGLLPSKLLRCFILIVWPLNFTDGFISLHCLERVTK